VPEHQDNEQDRSVEPLDETASTGVDTGATPAEAAETEAAESEAAEFAPAEAAEAEAAEVAPAAEPVVEVPAAEEPSLDEAIAALPVIEDHPAPESPDAALVEGVVGGVTWIPFAIYLGLWIVLAGVSAYLLYDAAADQPARWMPEYVPLLWSGVGLTVFGPVLSLVVWLVARSRRPSTSRRGLFASAMTRGAVVAFFGVAIWIATLFALEVFAAGGIS